MENPNHLNEPNEAIPEVNPVVLEPNQVANIHDPIEMVDIPDDIDLVDYDEEDPEEEPEEDVDIELEDDAELIFPYDVEGDKTPPPGDVSSDLLSSKSESEDEEVDVAPEATVGTTTQKPYAIRDFLRGLFKVGESYSAHDLSNIDGLALWALSRDLEAPRIRARVMEAELGTCQTKIALLKSKDKIREKERELLNHDLENFVRALGNVLERMSVLKSGENAILKKRLAETETKLVWVRMERETTKRRLHESRVWNKMFYLDMVHIGLFQSCHLMRRIPSVRERNQRTLLLMGPKDRPSHVDHLVTLSRLVYHLIMSPKAMSEARMHEIIRDQVRTSMADIVANINHRTSSAIDGGAGAGGAAVGGAGANDAGAGGAGVWWRRTGSTQNYWVMVEPEQVKVEQYIRGLSKNIRGDVTSSRPAGIDEAVRMAYQLMGQIIQDKTDEVSEGEKRKGEGDRSGRGDNRHD
nr:hypothetical protein [Tanacetum cinerariifolium]